MKLLCAADLHLGRQPSRLPDQLLDSGSRPTPAAAWRRLVDLALAEEVTAVLLAGDVLDDENDYFEAYGDLRDGAERLSQAGVQLIAVAGNHDVEVLPRLAASVPGVRLLGGGGQWEAVTLTGDGAAVDVLGWSWPAKTVVSSPLADLSGASLALPSGTVIGMLHCDLDQSASVYAPVSSLELAATNVDVWLLGHVHKPSFADPGSAGRWTGYLGSTFASDPGEEGDRGAWLLEVTGTQVRATPVPLSPLLFATVGVDVSELTSADQAMPAIVAAVREFGEELPTPSEGGPSAVGLRVRVVGRSPHASAIAQRLAKDDPRQFVDSKDGVTLFVHDVQVEVYAPLDLHELAKREDPIGLLARRLLLVDGPATAERSALLERARGEMLAVAAGRHYKDLEQPELSDEDVAGALRRAAIRFLEEVSR